jgi:hypothetical protein
MNGKIVARIIALAGIAGLGMALNASPASAQQEFGSPELIAAAKAEGKLVYYTANFAEVEQQVIKEFNKRFPEIRVEMVRAPGGQLITRVRTEAAAGKLIADVVDHSDRALMLPLADLFQDYAPPNAADYNPDAQISPKLWPRVTLVWSIAYNTELVKNPPKTWWDLTKPEYDKMTGQVFAQSGGTTWTRIMFERQVLGEDYCGRSRPRPIRSSIPPARRWRTRWCAAKSRWAPCSTMRFTRNRRTARRSRFSSRPRALRSIPMHPGFRKRQPIPMRRNCSSTGACRKKVRPS